MSVGRLTGEHHGPEFSVALVSFEKTPTDYGPNKKRQLLGENCKIAITRQACDLTKTAKKKTALFTETADNAKNEKTQTASRQKT